MEVYVSRSNDCNTVIFDLVLEELIGVDVDYHNPNGKYDPSKVPNCEAIIAIIDDGQTVIGRGQSEELKTAVEAGKLLYIVSICDDTVRVNSLEGMKKLDDRSWKKYSSIYYEFLAAYEIGSGGFVDFMQNAP